ncbi:phosphatase PAP2 family protein [Nakamurella sp. YIM 132087]|uniref:Phosphatase PAP2 family protein n=1 Tax=Nakamurella alba TaxID=2665158 RepID=A0A7K1FHC6_9ACTN|nr:phosphatase PAP2 family protein [Nakamurella alba]MTD13525.1 phosphatase PAP2 family protein [Nakamurella alba]
MRTTDETPDPMTVPAAHPVARPVDQALRLLTTSANHGVLWFGVAAIGALTGKRGRRAALRGVGSLAVSSFLSNTVIKPLVGRRRPDIERTVTARRIGKTPWTSSFPSGHSASAAAFATGAALEMPAALPVLAPLAAAVAYSRVHVGVHYRSDVITGAAIGVAVALAGRWLWPVKPWGPANTAPADAPALSEGEGLTIVLNEKSGSSDGAEDELSAALPKARIVQWDPENQSLEDAIGTGMKALGVAGGDGTVASVATIAQERGLPLAVFPFGTLNHFAGALGLNTHAQAIDAVEAGTAGGVDIARINGDLFLNTASIGGYPDMVIRRDRYTKRMGKWPATALALIRTLRRHTPMDLEINGHRAPVWVVFVGNGVYRPRGLAPAWREDLVDGLLDVQYLRADKKLARTRGVIYSLIGMVERSTVFHAVDAEKVTIIAHGGPEIPAHDGEVGEASTTITFEVDPELLTVYRP